ncbi:hypothetical protein AaE_010628 [Aphanomyces astaci]|uniref:Aminotransferase class I/classII large domain-containing protein n=1 Tax=Aphanomyces astaci TaxID=112090 RepID=A0A6A4ZYQ1_APHAT|nr:hypothetical protein AaE_010628 [Aphanomyces astaci]
MPVINASVAATLSARGRRALQPALSYFQLALDALAHEATDDDLDGYVSVAISENRILDANKMLTKLNESCAAASQKSGLGYDDFTGRLAFKQAYASFVKETLLKPHNTTKAIDPTHLAISSGVGSLLAHLSSLLHDEGDAVLLPTPAYGALYNDFFVSSGTKVIDVPMTPTFDITTDALQAGYDQAVLAGHTPKSVLLLNPENPLGIIRSSQTLRAISTWCEHHHLHLIVDEIYANSIHSPEQSPHAFESGATIFDTSVASASFVQLPPHVHILWGLSKDWAASGLRVGVVYTGNPDLLRALSNVLYFSGVSNYLLDGLALVLSDLPWSTSYIADNNRDLRHSYTQVASVLTKFKVPFVPAPAGMFVWVDFSAFLDTPTWHGERALTDVMFDKCKFIMTPGEAQHAPTPGFYRICFAYNTPKTVVHGLTRTLTFLTTQK